MKINKKPRSTFSLDPGRQRNSSPGETLDNIHTASGQLNPPQHHPVFALPCRVSSGLVTSS